MCNAIDLVLTFELTLAGNNQLTRRIPSRLSSVPSLHVDSTTNH